MPVTAEAHGSWSILSRLHTKLADMTGDPSIFLHFSSRHSKAFQIPFSSVMFSSSHFPRSSRPDEIYNPSGKSRGLPRGLLPVGHAWKMLIQLPPKMAETTSEKDYTSAPPFQHFGCCPDQQIKCFGSRISFPFTTTVQGNTQITAFALIFLTKSPRCFGLLPQGKASPMNGGIKHFLA